MSKTEYWRTPLKRKVVLERWDMYFLSTILYYMVVGQFK